MPTGPGTVARAWWAVLLLDLCGDSGEVRWRPPRGGGGGNEMHGRGWRDGAAGGGNGGGDGRRWTDGRGGHMDAWCRQETERQDKTRQDRQSQGTRTRPTRGRGVCGGRRLCDGVARQFGVSGVRESKASLRCCNTRRKGSRDGCSAKRLLSMGGIATTGASRGRGGHS